MMLCFVLPKSGDQRQVEIEHILQPLYRRGRLVRQNLDQIWPGLVSCGFQRVVVELLDAVTDLGVDLCSGESTVDARCRLGRVSAKET